MSNDTKSKKPGADVAVISRADLDYTPPTEPMSRGFDPRELIDQLTDRLTALEARVAELESSQPTNPGGGPT